MTATDHLVSFMPAACAGIGLLLIGGANLLLIGAGPAVRGVASLGATGLTLGIAASLDQPGLVLHTLAYLAACLLAVSALGARRIISGAAWLAGCVTGRPAVRHALVSAIGLALVVGSVISLEQADEQALDGFEREIELFSGHSPGVPTDKARAMTDAGRPITLREPETEQDPDLLAAVEKRTLENARLDESVIRRGDANNRCNCHGWVFTGGLFKVAGNDVERILEDNGYVEVDEPQPGDLVVYRNAGEVVHTGLVRYVTEGQPVLVEGKWGNLGVFLHPADRSVYGTDYTFYRTSRPNHLLAGLYGAPVIASHATASTEKAVATE